MAGTLLRLGWTDPRTGLFGAHPQLGGPLDLNDGVTFTLLDGELDIALPPRELALSGNTRAQGERGLRALYRHNRRATARLILGPMASYGDLAATIRTLSAWVAAPPALPVTLLWQAPGAASPVYLDVVGMASDIPTAERDWLRLQTEPAALLFITRPGLRGDRVTLQNLVMNPGFEAPSGPGVTVFNDPLTSAGAYTTLYGAAASAASNLLTIPAGGAVRFGSPAWSAIQSWTLRFKWAASLTATFDLHYTNGSNKLQVFTNGAEIEIDQIVAGTDHQLGITTGLSLAAGTFYWLSVTQFPGVAGNPPLVQAALSNDASGALGSQLASVGPFATYDAVTALAGQMAIEAGGAGLVIGGAYPGVHSVALFGPGGWLCQDYLPTSSYTPGSYAWEQIAANTYPGGPVASFGAARVDIPSSGFYNVGWDQGNTASLAALRQTAIPVAAAQDVLAVSLALKASGLSANGAIQINANHYNASGAFVSTTFAVATHSGSTSGWITLGATWPTPANTAFVALTLVVYNAVVAGQDAGGTVWFDNIQVYDQTATGQTSMPYCELRFPQAPAQLLVSGLLGDLPAPAQAALGTYLASWPVGSSLTWALGRRASASAAARLASASYGYQPPNTGSLAPAVSSALDAASYGGYYLTTTLSNGFNPRALSFAPADLPGVYHLFGRAWSAQISANLPNVQMRVVTQQRSQPWFGASDTSDQTGQYSGPWIAPLAAASTWTLADAGQVNVPALPAGALTDLTQGYLTPRAQWKDSSTPSAAFRANWQALLPVDGSLLLGVANNPANGPFGVTSSWLWLYLDGMLVNRGGPGDGPAATLSVETGPLANPARGGGGPGTQSTGAIGVNSGADPYLTLDPTAVCPAGAGGIGVGGAGVNQLTALLADGAGAVLPIACDLIYTPLYLYPR